MDMIGILTRVHESRQNLLSRAAQSLFAQSYTDWQWVIVTHGGYDKVIDLMKEFDPEVQDRIVCVDSGIPPEQYENGRLLNVALAHVQTEWLICLDEDDTWEPELLQSLKEAAEQTMFPSVVGVVCQSRRIQEQAQEQGWPQEMAREDLNPCLGAVTLVEMALENRFTNHALLLKRAVVQELGGWNEELPMFVDWEFNLRLLTKGDLMVVPKVLANYHQRVMGSVQQNMSLLTSGNRRETARAVMVNQFLRNPQTPVELREALIAGAGNRELREELRRCLRKSNVISERVGKIDARTKALKDQLL